MSTFAQAHFSSLPDRWREIDTLLDAADGQPSKQSLVDALCRAAIVLTVAHFEGFLKLCAKAIINDINKNSGFMCANRHVQRTFCRTLLGTGLNPGKEENEREVRLMSLLGASSIEVDATPFTQGTSNPTPDVVDRICGSLGAPPLFSSLTNSRCDIVFTNIHTDSLDLLRELEQHLLAGTMRFPYSVDTRMFLAAPPTAKQGKSLWEEFLNTLLHQRHEIAHGSATQNARSTAEVRDMQLKTRILLCVAMLGMCSGQGGTS